jgi:carbamoyl-phosphate synthase large subunit
VVAVVAVLVTGAGGASGVGAIRSLHATTDHEVVGVDMDGSAAGVFLADDGRAVPPASGRDWADSVLAFVDEFDVDVVVPTVDEELRRLDELRDTVPVVAPRQQVIDLALDKYRCTRRLEEAGHVVPDTWLASDRPEFDASAFPLLAKPRSGRGSRGVERLEDAGALDAYLANTDRSPEEIIIQEYIGGPEFTTSVVATTDGRTLSVVPKEALEKDGSTVDGVTRRATAVAESCRAVADTLNPCGPMNVQQMLDDEGRPHTIEVNPRFSSTSCLTVAAGVDEFDLLVRDAAGERVESPGAHEPGVRIRRYLDHVFVRDEDVREVEGAVE